MYPTTFQKKPKNLLNYISNGFLGNEPKTVQKPQTSYKVTTASNQSPQFQSRATPAYTPVPQNTTFQKPTPQVDPIQAIRDRQNVNSQARIDQLKNRQLQGSQEVVSRYAQQAGDLKNNLSDAQKLNEKAIKGFKSSRDIALSKEDTSAGQRLAEEAQAQRENRAQLDNKFAALGTIDSGGRFGYTGEAQKSEDNFLKRGATIRDTRDNNKKELDLYYTNLIDTETANFNQAVREVQSALANNPAQMNAEINKLMMDFEDKMWEVDKAYNTDTSELDKWFLTNQDKVQAMSGNNQEKQSLLDVITNIENGDIGGITGLNQLKSFMPGTNAALTKNYYEQLKGLLSLENRQRLKGSGAISDFESKTLEKAASALGRNLSEDQFRQVLADLRAGLGGSQSNAGYSPEAINALKQNGFTDVEIAEYFGGQ